ncbi:M20 family metallopeptidase [Paenibacillus sp. HB172176]|uniref:M20 metallopeptidase family protein n=1 Tax=Paenibacillus sp. HB172176 TaxID=2493690 RepID=UPI001F105EA4|nr:M20 family metallopeptidase [Paenibacillus sp. HB172176]
MRNNESWEPADKDNSLSEHEKKQMNRGSSGQTKVARIEDSLAPLLEEALELQAELVGLRRHLHRNPELSLEETETSQTVLSVLRELPLDIRTNVGGYGIVADLNGEGEGPTIALRADMDALPIQEETDLPYASEIPGKMHACGHDAHTAILVGAAKLLSRKRDKLSGRVRFLFQCAEEINQGARAMIEDGALDGVDEIYGLHNLPTLAAGKVATRYGALMGSVDRIEVTIEGRGGHGAIPNESIDPIVAASAVVMGLQTAVSREISPFDPAVVTIGSIYGGHANNVIPHRVELTGTVRTFQPRVQEGMEAMLRRLIESICEGYRCKAELRYIRQVPVLVNHDACVTHVEQTLDGLMPIESRIEAAPTMAGEDFSLYVERIPGCFFWIGSGPEENAEQAYGLHHPKFDLNEECLGHGAAALAGIAFSRLL